MINSNTMTALAEPNQTEAPTAAQDHLRLLVIAQGAETFLQLRNLCEAAGYSLDAVQVKGIGEFQEALRRQPWDLILSARRLPEYCVEQALRLLTRLDIDVPVIVVDERNDRCMVSRVLHAGARDVVSPAAGEHLQCVVRREMADLETRRTNEHYKRLMNDYERRLTQLLEQAAIPREPEQPRTDAAAPWARDTKLAASPDVAEAEPPQEAGEACACADGLAECLPEAIAGLSTAKYRALLVIEPEQAGTLQAELGDAPFGKYLHGIEEVLQANLTGPHSLHLDGDYAFAVVACDEEPKGLARIAEAIRQCLENHVTELDGRSIPSTASIGMCVFDGPVTDHPELVAVARAARDKARSSGGNRVSVAAVPTARPPQSQSASDPWTTRLHEALQNNRFRLVFHPVVNFHAEVAETYETLLRMVDEHGLEIQPGQFIPKAEERGLMPEIDRWVVKAAAETLLQRRKEGFETRFFVKLSRASVDTATFLPWLKGYLGQMRLPGQSFILQLSEDVVAGRMERMKDFMQQLTAMGCAVALDHFGSRADSLRLLRQLPVQFLKIDGQLVQSLSGEGSGQNKLKELVDAAHGAGMVAIATFVQDPYTLSILWRCGVDYVQGFYFQAPAGSMLYDFSSALV